MHKHCAIVNISKHPLEGLEGGVGTGDADPYK
jgi:hypothetical protein